MPKLFLTFDDGPDPICTPRVLDVLARHGAHATFFLIAEKAEEQKKWVKEIQRAGHAIGNHSLDHRYRYFFLGKKSLRNWILDAHLRLKNILGESPVGFRPPAGVRTPELYSVLEELQMPLVMWNQRFFDGVFPLSEKRLLSSLNPPQDNSIVLLHDRQKAKRVEGFVQALDSYLTKGRALGIEFKALENKNAELERETQKFLGSNSCLVRVQNKLASSGLRKSIAEVGPLLKNPILITRFFGQEPRGLSTEQAAQWAGSRKALVRVIRELGVHQELSLSLAHTHNVSFALGVTLERREELQVGIDVEYLKREISAAASERFILAAERNYGLSPIVLWAIKEACYKANPLAEGTTVSQYELTDVEPTSRRVKLKCLARSEFLFEATWILDDGMVVAIAKARRV